MVLSMETSRMNGAAMSIGRNGHSSSNGNYAGSDLPGGEVLDLHRVLETVQADDEGKWDTTVFRDQLTMLNGKLLVPEYVEANGVEELSPTPWATAQMCGRLGIPTAYFRRCPVDLQDANFNVWARHSDRLNGSSFENGDFENGQRNGNGHSNGNGHRNDNSNSHTARRIGSSSERWLLRVKHDSVRGVLSDRYTRVDNEPFLKTLEPLVPERLQVKWFALTGESLHLRLIDPTLAREVLPDDRLMVGLHIANSEVGKRAVTVDAIVWRLVCDNGLVRLVKGRSLMHQRHMFVSSSGFRNDLERAMGEALTTAAGLLERMAQATTEHLDDVETLIEKIGEKHQLSEAFQEKIKQALLREPNGQQETTYGLTNAVTEAAQSLSADDRYAMEVIAGDLMQRGSVWLNGLPQPKVRVKRKLENSMAGVPAPETPAIPLRVSSMDATKPNGADGGIQRHHIGTMRNGGVGAVSCINGSPSSPLPPQPNGSSAVQLATRIFGAPPTSDASQVAPLQDASAQETGKQPEPETASGQESESGRLPVKIAVVSTSSDLRTSDKPASRSQLDVLLTIAKRRGLGSYDFYYLLQHEFGKSEADDLTQAEATRFTILLQQRTLHELTAPVPDFDDEEDENRDGDDNDE